MSSANPFEYWRLAGAAMMLEPFESIQRREFPLINFRSKSEWNRWSKHPTSNLNCYTAEVINVDDRVDIQYRQ